MPLLLYLLNKSKTPCVYLCVTRAMTIATAGWAKLYFNSTSVSDRYKKNILKICL